jgi:hypothetical protein
MRTLRTEIVTIYTARLARHALTHHFHQAGLVRVSSTPVEHGTLLTVASDEIIDISRYHWFSSRKNLDAVLHEMVTLEAMPWVASRVGDGVLLNVHNSDVGAVIAECARWCNRSWAIYITHAEINERLVSVEAEIKRQLVKLQVTGRLKELNAEYKALRTGRAEGEKLPSFKNWASARIEAQILARLNPAVVA